MAPNNNDPFDTLFNLEDQYYRDGFTQGAADGARAGRIEGRLFGYEKAFEKFVRLGRLHGRALVLQERLSLSAGAQETARDTGFTEEVGSSTAPSVKGPGLFPHPQQQEEEQQHRIHGPAHHFLSSLPPAHRLAKHVQTLHALTEPPTFSTQNDEDAVADLDDRLRRADAKAKLIHRLLGGAGDAEHALAGGHGQGQDSLRRGNGTPGNGDMEEFALKVGKARTAG